MARSHGLWLVVGVFAACGGQGSHDDQNGAAGVAGTAQSASGSSGQSAGGTGQSTGGGGGAHVAAGSAGRAGAGTAGLAGGGAASGGVAGSGGGSSGAGGGLVTTPEMLVPTAQAYCATARICCAKQTDPVHLDDCESAYATRGDTSKTLPRGTVTIDPADLAKCQAAYVAAATTCEQTGVLAACAGIVHGKVAEGGACLLVQECAGKGPLVCLITGPGQDALGVCKSTPGGKVGDACALTCRPNEICSFTVYGIPDSALTPCLESDGVFCNTDTGTAKCEAIHALGSACQNDYQCGYYGYCDSGGSKTCKKRSQLNEACGTCIAELMCKDGKCQSPPLTVGGTCDGYAPGPY